MWLVVNVIFLVKNYPIDFFTDDVPSSIQIFFGKKHSNSPKYVQYGGGEKRGTANTHLYFRSLNYKPGWYVVQKLQSIF